VAAPSRWTGLDFGNVRWQGRARLRRRAHPLVPRVTSDPELARRAFIRGSVAKQARGGSTSAGRSRASIDVRMSCATRSCPTSTGEHATWSFRSARERHDRRTSSRAIAAPMI
jgi:hypothetical protein